MNRARCLFTFFVAFAISLLMCGIAAAQTGSVVLRGKITAAFIADPAQATALCGTGCQKGGDDEVTISLTTPMRAVYPNQNTYRAFPLQEGNRVTLRIGGTSWSTAFGPSDWKPILLGPLSPRPWGEVTIRNDWRQQGPGFAGPLPVRDDLRVERVLLFKEGE
jgi:hypothetical protein